VCAAEVDEAEKARKDGGEVNGIKGNGSFVVHFRDPFIERKAVVTSEGPGLTRDCRKSGDIADIDEDKNCDKDEECDVHGNILEQDEVRRVGTQDIVDRAPGEEHGDQSDCEIG